MAKTTDLLGLPYPESNEIADVPEDIKKLALKIEGILDSWYSPAEQAELWQRRVIITTGLPANGNEGDIVFLVTE